MTLPADSHVHSEYSWDAKDGSMEGACERAVALGLPAIAFTEHVDYTVWTITPPEFDAAGYLEAVEGCRERFPGLRILTGMEVGEPHWHAAKIPDVGRFDRVLGSLHCLADGDGFAEPYSLYGHRPAARVVRDYLAEIPNVVSQSGVFSVLAHIDYPVRYWPDGEFNPFAFEEEFRHALRMTAESGRALEINTTLPVHATLVRWWHEEGGQAVSFGSDAHEPLVVARRFREAADMARANGFRPGREPYDLWGRS